MPTNTAIKIKRSLSSGVIPTSLELGEMAVNIADKKIWIGNASSQPILISDYLNAGTNLSAGTGIEISTNDVISIKTQDIIDIIKSSIDPGSDITITETTNGITINTSVWTNSGTTTATDIAGISAGTSLTGKTAIEILEQILYVYQPVTVSSFNIGFVTTNYEIGQSTTSGNQTSTWSATNTGNIANGGTGAVSITYTGTNATRSGGTTSGTLASGVNYSATPYTINHLSYTSNTVGGSMNFKVIIDQQQGSDAERNTSTPLYWWSRMYWGRSSSSNETTYANLTGGSNTLVTSTGSFSQSTTYGTSTGTYLYIFFLSSKTLSSIYLNPSTQNSNVTNSFEQMSNRTITNAYGQSVTYKVYKSVEQLGGNDTYLVNLT